MKLGKLLVLGGINKCGEVRIDRTNGSGSIRSSYLAAAVGKRSHPYKTLHCTAVLDVMTFEATSV
jgi:20S proteasome alpha/beta subunit